MILSDSFRGRCPSFRTGAITAAVAVAVLGLMPAPRAGAQAPPTPPVPTKTAPAPGPSPATPPGQVGFKGYGDIPGAVQFVTAASEDKQVITVIFRNLDAQSGPMLPLVGTRALTLELPMTNTSKTPVHITQDIRGFVAMTPRANVSLVMRAGGQTTVIDPSEDPSGADAEKTPAIEKVHQAAQARAASLPPAPARPMSTRVRGTFDFTKRVEARIAPGASYTVTFGLLAERDANPNNESALITIDSLDVAIVPAPPAAK